MPIAAAMLRPSSKVHTGSKPKRAPSPSPSPSPSPATAPRANKNLGGAGTQRRRSPLSDLNSGDASAARVGCFRFLLSSASGSKSRGASAPRTPASGPKPRARQAAGVSNRLPDQESRTKTEQWGGRESRSRRHGPIGGQIKRTEPEKQEVARRQQHRQIEALTPERMADAGATPSSGATPPIHASISPEVVADGGCGGHALFWGYSADPRVSNRLPDQESRTKTEQWGGRESRSRRHEPIGGQIKRTEPEKQEVARRQQHRQIEALTPERMADAEATPSSGATPPIHASISPEVVACGSATPACFAAGHHVVPGVRDRRKCRARGILEIAREESSEELDTEPSRAPILWPSSPSGEAGTCSTKCAKEESIIWLSSSSGEAGTCSTKCGKESSVIWLSSPRQEASAGFFDDEIFLPRCSLEDKFWRISPDCTGLLGSPVLGGLDFETPVSEISETTPSSGFLPVQKTPSTGGSISPFSLIVKRASHSSRLRSLCAQEGLGSYLYGSAEDLTPFSGERWSENASNGKCSGLTRTSSRHVVRMEPVVECLEMMSLSPRPGDPDYDENGALPAPLPELSFQFTGAPTPLESIDLSSFKRSPCDTELKGKEASFRKPVLGDARISWREGLVSRMFDIGDLDCCKWLSDDEDGPIIQGSEEALPDTMFQPTSASCLQVGGDQPASASCGFGSFEFSLSGGETTNGSKASSPNPVSVAESMLAEGFELVSSDEDWTLFYKNSLFET